MRRDNPLDSTPHRTAQHIIRIIVGGKTCKSSPAFDWANFNAIAANAQAQFTVQMAAAQDLKSFSHTMMSWYNWRYNKFQPNVKQNVTLSIIRIHNQQEIYTYGRAKKKHKWKLWMIEWILACGFLRKQSFTSRLVHIIYYSASILLFNFHPSNRINAKRNSTQHNNALTGNQNEFMHTIYRYKHNK